MTTAEIDTAEAAVARAEAALGRLQEAPGADTAEHIREAARELAAARGRLDRARREAAERRDAAERDQEAAWRALGRDLEATAGVLDRATLALVDALATVVRAAERHEAVLRAAGGVRHGQPAVPGSGAVSGVRVGDREYRPRPAVEVVRYALRRAGVTP